MNFKTIDSQTIFQGRVFNVRQDQVRLPDGADTVLDIIEHAGAVAILPVDTHGNVWFVRQYRHAAGSELLELPAGGLEPNEPPEVCADRETREEIGMSAKKYQRLGGFYMAPGYSTEFLHVFLAMELFEAPLKGDSDEFLSIERIHFNDIPDMIEKGKITDGKTLAVFQLAKPYLSGIIFK